MVIVYATNDEQGLRQRAHEIAAMRCDAQKCVDRNPLFYHINQHEKADVVVVSQIWEEIIRNYKEDGAQVLILEEEETRLDTSDIQAPVFTAEVPDAPAIAQSVPTAPPTRRRGRPRKRRDV